MPTTQLSFSRRAPFVIAVAFACYASSTWAQAPTEAAPSAPAVGASAPEASGDQAPAPARGRPDQRIEKIRTEDAGSRIDEVRVGGQTQSITVSPKADVPGYHIQPTEGARAHPSKRDGSESSSGSRVWNVLKF